MRIFLSHASSDAEIALAIQLRLEELHNVRCFVSLTGTAPGDDWELHIRQNASDCDAIACLVTPSYIQRPWFYAEWAVFWFQNKPW